MLTNCPGTLLARDAVVYSNCFQGLVGAHLKYELREESLTQFLVLETSPESSPAWPDGLDASDCAIEVWTTWDGGEPVSSESRQITFRDATVDGTGVLATDTSVDFTTLKIVGEGKAFNLQNPEDKIAVAKAWNPQAGKAASGHGAVLIESVDWKSLVPKLKDLPKATRPKTASITPQKREKLLATLSGQDSAVSGSKSRLAAGRGQGSAIQGSSRRDAFPSTTGGSSAPMLVALAPQLPMKAAVIDFTIVCSVAVPANAISWWPAGGATSDAVGSNHGYLTNGATYAAGEVGQGFSLDGVNDYVGAPRSSSMNPGNQVTIEFWMRADSDNAMNSYQGLVTTPYYEVEISNGLQQRYGVNFGLSTDARQTFAMTSEGTNGGGAVVSAGVWHHVAGTYDGAQLQLYIDGQAWGGPIAHAGTITSMEAGTFLCIGSEDGRGEPPLVGQRYFKGRIDEAAIYSRALSASEILAIYNAGGAGKYNANCVSPPANAVAWWPGDANTYDLARTNFGTLKNGATFSSGRVSSAYDLNSDLGSDDYVEVPQNSAWVLGGNNFTIELWANLRSNYTSVMIDWPEAIFVANDEGPYNVPKWWFARGAGLLHFHVNGPGLGPQFLVQTTWNPSLNTWYHLAVVRNGTSLLLYTNGVLANTGSINFNIPSVSAPLTMGQGEGLGYVRGLLDEVTIYSRALSGTEISSIYSGGGAGKCKVDSDNDGLSDLQEAFLGTNPNNSDTDSDGLADGCEVWETHTSPGNGDQNSNNIPDGWEWNYFGSLQPGNTDYDSDGVSNWQEYQLGTNPNDIRFRVTAGSRNVNSRSVSLSTEIFGGVPSEMAVLIDSMDFNGAVWAGYTNNNLLVTLGSEDRDFEIWVGLRGRPVGSSAIWDSIKVGLDRASPALVVTSPTPGSTVSRPYLQIQGYSPEPIQNLVFNVTNAAGLTEERGGLVSDQFYDTNRYCFTTNTFELLDVDLTNGQNTVILRATDLAGNSTTNSFTFVLDLSSDTTPPLVAIYWPQDGAGVSGTNFTLRGSLDDPTATVVAKISGSSGQTNEVVALIERDGLLWVEGLSLEAGTNYLTLTATDAAGNEATTNITVVRSSVELAVAEVSQDQLHQLTITVTGTMDTPGYTVWVNGVKATDNGNGTWSANEVPLNQGCTTVIQARAIPNTDNGGDGSGGGGQPTYQNSANPSSAAAVNTEGAKQRPERIYVEKHFQEWTYNRHTRADFFANENGVPGVQIDWIEQDWREKAGHDWKDGKGGKGWWSRVQVDQQQGGAKYTNNCEATIVWPPSPYPNTLLGTWEVNAECIEPRLPENPPCIPMEHCDVKNTNYMQTPPELVLEPLHPHYLQFVVTTINSASSRTADATVKVFTGDKSVRHPNRQSVLELQVPVSQLTNGSLTCGLPGEVPVIPSGVNVGEIGKLNTDYTVYKVTEHGKTLDATVTAPPRRFVYPVNGGMHDLAIQCVCTVPKERERTTVGVGEFVGMDFEPAMNCHLPLWGHSGGGLNVGLGVPINGVTYTASSNAATDKVMANFPAPGGKYVTLTTSFSVLEPSGTDHADFVQYWDYPNTSQAGAGVHLRPYVSPTNVSFSRVRIMEVGQPASSAWGYFTSHSPPPHDSSSGADSWIPLSCDNSWDSNWDWARSWGWSPPWSTGGGYTWVIPAKWRVGSGPEHSMTGWSQVHTISSSGTMTVTKFGHAISRTIQNVYSRQ